MCVRVRARVCEKQKVWPKNKKVKGLRQKSAEKRLEFQGQAGDVYTRGQKRE